MMSYMFCLIFLANGSYIIKCQNLQLTDDQIFSILQSNPSGADHGYIDMAGRAIYDPFRETT